MKTRSLFTAFLGCGLLLVLCGCDTTPTTRDPWALREREIQASNYVAADHLAQQLRRPVGPRAPINPLDPIIVTTIADMNYLDGSSSFGRITGEQVASRLAQLGFHVIEVKLRDKLYIQTVSGEFILSRDVEQIAQKHEAVVVVTGAYAVGRVENLISLRAIALGSRSVIAAYDYAVPRVSEMLPPDYSDTLPRVPDRRKIY